MTGPIVLEVDFTREDFARLLVFQTERSVFVRRARLRRQLVLPAIGLALLIMLGPSLPTVTLVLGVSAAWVSLLPLYFQWNTRTRASRIAQREQCRGLIGEHRVVVDETGVLDSTPFYETRLLWAGVAEVASATDQIVFFLGGEAALSIPKRVFPSAGAVGTFLENVAEIRRAGSTAGV